jgi:hypothetical protein
MKKRPNKYPCPLCEVEFTASEVRLNDSKCPHCQAEVRAQRTHHKGHKGFFYTYIAVSVGNVVAQPPKKILAPPSNEKMISQPGEIVYQIGNERKYRVEYLNRIYTGWLFCPGCKKKMFKNTMVSSPVNVKQSHRCRRPECRADVQFIFRVSRPGVSARPASKSKDDSSPIISRPVIRSP